MPTANIGDPRRPDETDQNWSYVEGESPHPNAQLHDDDVAEQAGLPSTTERIRHVAAMAMATS
jgi:hypothetical protein